MKAYLLFICLFIACQSFANESDSSRFVALEKQMNVLIHEVLTNTKSTQRQQASLQLRQMLDSVLRIPGSFHYQFSKLEGVSIVQPSDASCRIFTWQLYLDNNDYKYRGFIQKANGKVYPLKDNSDDMRTVEFSVLKPQNWYGALYYNLHTFQHDGQTLYLLFGYDVFGFYNRRKLLDVLYFDEKGQPKFGKDVLEMKDGFGRKRTVKRFLLEYSASVNVSLNYDKTLEMVVYDHLIYGQPIRSAGPSNVPDGSYCGLKLNKYGVWEYIDKVHKDDPSKILVDATTYEKMIGTETKRKAQKDIFGRSK
jgi:hypothetical protein